MCDSYTFFILLVLFFYHYYYYYYYYYFFFVLVFFFVFDSYCWGEFVSLMMISMSLSSDSC